MKQGNGEQSGSREASWDVITVAQVKDESRLVKNS